MEKIEHSIYSSNCTILENNDGKAVIQLKNLLGKYNDADFNIHFAIQTLEAVDLLEKLSIGHYSVAKRHYLYDKVIKLDPIPYKGKLADEFTQLHTLHKAVFELRFSTDKQQEKFSKLMPRLEAYLPKDLLIIEQIDNISYQLSNQEQDVLMAIQAELKLELVRTIAWNRNEDGLFDYSLPTTLYLNTVEFEPKEYNKLMTVAQQIVQSFKVTRLSDEVLNLEVAYQNIQPKPKKVKTVIDFPALMGKTVAADDYFYGLTAKGWKYDLEDSDLFYTLSKTFWNKGFKVSLVFEDSCSIPPDGDEVVIQSIDAFSFNKKTYKERSIYTIFDEKKKQHKMEDFKTVEDYIAHLNEDNSFYVAHADFNTEDYDLLTRIELADLPLPIQKEVWADLSAI